MGQEYDLLVAFISRFHPFNLLIDVAVLVTTELLTRCVFSSNSGTLLLDSSTKQIHLLTVQGAVLILFTLSLCILHHTPYLLAFVTAFVLLKLFVMVASSHKRSQDEEYIGGYVSQPIKPPNWPSKRNLVQLVSNSGYSASPTTVHHSATLPGGIQCSNLSHRSSTDSDRSVPLVPSSVRTMNPTKQLTSLQRSPLSSRSLQRSSPTPTDPQSENSTRSSQSAYTFMRTNLDYFKSLFRHKNQSTSAPSGMYNLGNTCFINSTLQCLIWTDGFVDSLPYMSTAQACDDNTMLVTVLDDIVNVCHGHSAGDRPVDVTELLTLISRIAPNLVASPDTSMYQSQQDAAEFLLWLLNHLHSVLRFQSRGKSGLDVVLSESNILDLKKSKEACMATLQNSKSTDIPKLREPLLNLSQVDWQLHWQANSSTLYQLFLGQLIEARECQNCGRMSFNMEYFTLLPLPLPPVVDVDKHCIYTLGDCFELFSRTEDLTHTNMITCSCVGGHTLIPGKRLALLSHPPKSLVVQLTRYSYDSSQGVAVKNTVAVEFSLALDLFPHTMSSVLGSDMHLGLTVYELQGFCVHSGAQSTSYGHYIAYCKAINNRWYYFNDEHVVSVDDIEAELRSAFVLQNAYLLFYTLKKN